jgi:Patatin-like phospholipase
MLQARSEHDVAPDLVAGTSVGSLNGAALALDPTSGANRLSHAWARMTNAQVFPGGLLAQARTLHSPKPHLFPSTGLTAVIEQFLDDGSFDDLVVPFTAVAMDGATGRAHPIRHGPLLPALLASADVGRGEDRRVAPLDERDVWVTIESTSPTNRVALYVRACGLSNREAELPGHLVSGAYTAISHSVCSCPSTRSRTTSRRSSPRPERATAVCSWLEQSAGEASRSRRGRHRNACGSSGPMASATRSGDGASADGAEGRAGTPCCSHRRPTPLRRLRHRRAARRSSRSQDHPRRALHGARSHPPSATLQEEGGGEGVSTFPQGAYVTPRRRWSERGYV